MAEEPKLKMEDNKIVTEPSKEELVKLEKEINEKQNQTLDSVKKDVADSVRKEIKAENELDSMKQKNEDLEKAIEEQKETGETRMKELEEQMLQKIKDVENMKQGVASNDNPFKEGENKDQGLDLEDPEIVSSVEEESRLKYIEKMGLPDDWGQIR